MRYDNEKTKMEFEVARRAALYAYERYMVARARLKAAAAAAGVEFSEADTAQAQATSLMQGGPGS